jgi:hypothetical protein
MPFEQCFWNRAITLYFSSTILYLSRWAWPSAWPPGELSYLAWSFRVSSAVDENTLPGVNEYLSKGISTHFTLLLHHCYTWWYYGLIDVILISVYNNNEM